MFFPIKQYNLEMLWPSVGPAVHMEGLHSASRTICHRKQSVLPLYILTSRGLCNRSPVS